jgi:hypothetical protein
MDWSDHILAYHFNLSTELKLPKGIEWLYPYNAHETRRCMEAFYRKYYADENPRTMLLGINPGRFGGGTTGIPFTDPIRLETFCGIPNAFAKKQELSSVFIYDMIKAYGGTDAFYQSYYISALSPLGFVRDGKNYNYYDDAQLMEMLQEFILTHLRIQIGFGCRTDKVFCLGQGKNFAYLTALNDRQKMFEQVIALPHPRWIMQYRLKRKEEFLRQYLDAFND